jgi:nitroreductase
MSQPSPERGRALLSAAELAALAPSLHDTQPWLLELRDHRLLIRADRSRQLAAMDPTGRELVQSVGAALLNARVALAADGWAADVERLPDLGEPELLAVVRPVPGAPEPALAALAPAVPVRRTDRRAVTGAEVPDTVLRGLAATAAAEDAVLVPVLREAHRRLVARLTEQADRMQNAERGYRSELRQWTTGLPEPRDGVPAVAGPRAGTASGVADRTLVLLTTRSDDELAWLRSGEAMQRVLLELTRVGWAASPFPRAIEVPLTRVQLRSALAWDAHPQLLLRIGRAGPTPATPRRPLDEVVVPVTG